ncbi:hypothetical protein GCM10007377_15220 [Galliscardovia ingluviei]|uniref:Uncharacterized protein n=1 Tax=Galliscardovia ingluviei TaxID=1769422 RepID=A0A8J3AQY8_9BIFI|nr:hypothetical protein [Galliscardovia ingluviei]GGI15302.1 hypothetical protein GCM10007377_15220 [Galliscardovia ingluviei]
MNQEERYEAMSDYFVEHTPQLGEHVVALPHRQIEVSDLDDIFAGRPLAEQPRYDTAKQENTVRVGVERR